ncbi:MAG: hypothetical protein ACMUIU_19405 [bacterium]
MASSMIDGWYFIHDIEPGIYGIILKGDDPNIILKNVLEFNLASRQIKRIEDIVLDFHGNWKDMVMMYIFI